MARTASADTIEMLRTMIADAEAADDRPSVVRLNLVLGLITQLVNVTPSSPAYLRCEQCKGTGRVPSWFHATGEYIDVFCGPCQGSGETWNPHPNVHHPRLKGDM
jgi:hypothetical protein